LVKQTEKYLAAGVHFNFYMVHGGTNFGFTSGANYNDEHDIQPDITSYDYDAPISEAGWPTEKYRALRDVMKKYVTYPVPEIPAKAAVVKLQDIAMKKSVDFFEWRNSIKPVVNETPLTFEDLNQGTGYVLYSKRFNQPIQGTLQVKGLRDYALVYVNGKKVGELSRQSKTYSLEVNIPFNGRLDLLVENMGRINYGAEIVNSTKGIVSPVLINDYEITGDWNMYRVPLNEMPALAKYAVKNNTGLPVFYTATFDVSEAGDTFLDMQGWGKGIVFVNGHHLGRYWKVGPQQTLYLPGCWLKKGANEIVIFEQQNDNPQQVLKTVTTPVLDLLPPAPAGE
jgi:beta-galactosidase